MENNTFIYVNALVDSQYIGTNNRTYLHEVLISYLYPDHDASSTLLKNVQITKLNY